MENSGGIVVPLVMLAIMVMVVASVWIVFTKAGQPGWAALIPIYNVFILVQIAGMPGWWVLVFFVPVLNLVPTILVPLGVAKNFGKGSGFAVGLILLPFIFYPLLAFGDAKYSG